MKITVEVIKGLFSKKLGYIASFGKFAEKGSTKEEAKENLITALEWYFDYYDYEDIYKTIPESGVTVVLKRTFEGYTIQTIYHDGRLTMGSSHYGRITHSEAMKHLNSHAAGYLPVTTYEE